MSIPLPSLKAPPSRLIVEQSHFSHPQSRHLSIIQSHAFNYKLETIIPDKNEDTKNGDDSMCEETYYEGRIQAGCLIHKAFIEAFIKRGSFVLISVQTDIDSANVLALDARGHLFLHLTRESYQQLGIDGKCSQHCKTQKLPQKYVVEIDLTAPYFQPGKPNYERVRECLLNNHTQYYKVIFNWIPDDEKIAPISVCKYFESLGYMCKVVTTKVAEAVRDDIVSCPLVSSDSFAGDQSVDCMLLWEWLGAVTCLDHIKFGVDLSDQSEFVSSYVSPEPHRKVDCVRIESMTGFIHANDISSRLEVLRRRARTCGWCALTVHGFHDSPVTFHSKEHGFLLDGDNLYTFVVFADGTYWLYTGLSSYDDTN